MTVIKIRVGVCGCAGSGKSSFAEALAKALGMPFLKSKEITQDILSRDGYDYSSGVQIERFLANSGRQNEILRRTMEQQAVEQFVTDRTVVDLAAYVVCEMNSETNVVQHILEACKRNVTNYTHLFLCPWQDIPVTDNNRRTLKPYYQFMIHVVECGIMDDWGVKYSIIKPAEAGERVKDALSILDI
jgi:predicted ATPase